MSKGPEAICPGYGSITVALEYKKIIVQYRIYFPNHEGCTRFTYLFYGIDFAVTVLIKRNLKYSDRFIIIIFILISQVLFLCYATSTADAPHLFNALLLYNRHGCFLCNIVLYTNS